MKVSKQKKRAAEKWRTHQARLLLQEFAKFIASENKVSKRKTKHKKKEAK